MLYTKTKKEKKSAGGKTAKELSMSIVLLNDSNYVDCASKAVNLMSQILHMPNLISLSPEL